MSARPTLTRRNWIGPTVHLSTCRHSDGCKWIWAGRFLCGWHNGHPRGKKWTLGHIRACKVCRPDETTVGLVSERERLAA